MIKIIHCLNSFLPGQVAGTEVYTHSLVKELQQKNMVCLVLIPNYGKAITEEYEVNGIRVIQFAEPSVVDRALLMGERKPDGLLHFIKVIKAEKPAIVHFHVVGGSNGIGLHHVLAVKQMGIKMLMTLHLAGYTCKTNNLLYKNQMSCDGLIDVKKCSNCVFASMQMGFVKRNILYAAAITAHALNYNTSQWNTALGTAISYPFLIANLKKKILQIAECCDKMIVLTHWYKKVLEANGVTSNKLVHIPQGLPSQESHLKFFLQKGILKLAFVGRINYSKGLHLLIEAVNQLPTHVISVDIYGQVDEDEYARKYRMATATMQNIQWKGVIAPDQIVKKLSGYHALCLPSVICEMSPLVIQEAFAAKLPVIASNVYGNAEQIKHGINGLLFNFNDSEDLLRQLNRCLNEINLLPSLAKNIIPPRTFDKVGDEYIELYKSLIN